MKGSREYKIESRRLDLQERELDIREAELKLANSALVFEVKKYSDQMDDLARAHEALDKLRGMVAEHEEHDAATPVVSRGSRIRGRA